MEHNTIDIKALNEFLPYLQQYDNGDNINEKLRISLAIGLFISKTVSLERAASLAHYSTPDFVALLIHKNIPWQEYTEESYELDNTAERHYNQQISDD